MPHLYFSYVLQKAIQMPYMLNLVRNNNVYHKYCYFWASKFFFRASKNLKVMILFARRASIKEKKLVWSPALSYTFPMHWGIATRRVECEIYKTCMYHCILYVTPGAWNKKSSSRCFKCCFSCPYFNKIHVYTRTVAEQWEGQEFWGGGGTSDFQKRLNTVNSAY